MIKQSIEKLEVRLHEMRELYEFHMNKASEWYQDIRHYEQVLNEMNEEEEE